MKVTRSLLDDIVIKKAKWHGHIQSIGGDRQPSYLYGIPEKNEKGRRKKERKKEKADQKLFGWMELVE